MSKRVSGPPRRPRNPVAKAVRTPRDRGGRSRGPFGDATPERDAGAPGAVAGIPSAARSPYGGPSGNASGRHRQRGVPDKRQRLTDIEQLAEIEREQKKPGAEEKPDKKPPEE